MNIPVVINNFNRLTTTKNMVERLLSLNPKQEIIIIDNASTYAPLLSWYDKIDRVVVVHYHKNEGHLALWATGLDKLLPEHFVYTDSDIELNADMPADWLEIMYNVMYKSMLPKVALAIRIDDLPDHYRFKQQVIRNEGRWWLQEVEPDIYKADTDTTFALYRNTGDNTYNSVRLARKDLICRHLPWYLDLDNLSIEEQYIIDNLSDRVTTQYSKQHKYKSQYNDI